MSGANHKIIFVSGASIHTQPWWHALHRVIIEAFLSKDHAVFPPTWTRLNPDPSKGAEGLSHELGSHGHLAVAFSAEGTPVGCGGVLPYRGDAWINAISDTNPELRVKQSKSADQVGEKLDVAIITAWETCCFCVHPSQRGKGLSRQLLYAMEDFVKGEGAERLYSNYAIDETGDFWAKLGFVTVRGADSMLTKGFKVDPDKEGLRDNIYFKTGMKALL